HSPSPSPSLHPLPPPEPPPEDVTSMKSHVAGNAGALPRDVEIKPTAIFVVVFVNQDEGTVCLLPTVVTAPVLPLVVAEYFACTVDAAGSTSRYRSTKSGP